jgi:hypothetical protein
MSAADAASPGAKTARLYRMVMDKHVCPYGTKSKWLLEREGFAVEDHWLTTREQTDAFKAQHGVDPADLYRGRADRRLQQIADAFRLR